MKMKEKMKDNGRMLIGLAGEAVFPFFFEIHPDFVKNDVKVTYYYKEPDVPFLQMIIEEQYQENDPIEEEN